VWLPTSSVASQCGLSVWPPSVAYQCSLRVSEITPVAFQCGLRDCCHTQCRVQVAFGIVAFGIVGSQFAKKRRLVFKPSKVCRIYLNMALNWAVQLYTICHIASRLDATVLIPHYEATPTMALFPMLPPSARCTQKWYGSIAMSSARDIATQYERTNDS
jgi:hypothetical protein